MIHLIYYYIKKKYSSTTSKKISMIKEKFGATYFPQTNIADVPNEGSLGQASVENHEINITRKTSIKELLK